MKTHITPIKEVFSSKRMDGSFHNADINIFDGVLRSHSSHTLDYYCSSIFTSNRGKRIYTEKDFGFPFLSNSDMVASDPFLSCNWMSKKYSYDESFVLKKGMILTGRVGAIGQTGFVPEYWEKRKAMGSDNIIRIVVKPTYKNGFLYAYLASKFGYLSFWKHATGGVQPFITDKMVGSLPIPDFPASFQQEVDDLIQESARLREEATDLIEEAERILIEKACLRDLTSEDYNYFGPRSYKREVSCFVVKRSEISTTTINAFNLSRRTKAARELIKVKTLPLAEVLKDGETFSSPAVSSTAVNPEHGILFINQKDIFDNIIKGKYVSKRNIQTDKLVKYGEVLVACDGTLGEGELFCHCLFANEDLDGALISTHFLRMITNDVVPSGYLFSWLNSKYGFRFIRSTQAGTKLCHPIPKLFLDIPVPILDSDDMMNIDNMIKSAFTKRYLANCNERKAIQLVEQEIEKWGN